MKRPSCPTVTIHRAKTQLSKLLELISFGCSRKRTLGLDAGHGFIAPDFDAPLSDEVLSDFER
jgi:hypothetical protein